MTSSYPSYKPTPIPWLPQIPEHWELRPIMSFTKTRSIKNQTNLPLLSVYRDYGVILKSSREDNHNKAGEDLNTYKVVKKGDLVLNKMKTWQGSLGVSDHDGIVSPAYIVCKMTYSLNGRYIHYLLRSSPYINEYNRLSYGIRNDQWDMRYEDFKRVPVYLPPLPEQTAIANYLDSKTDEINTFIAKKEKLIALLKEQKQAIINNVIKKGANKSAKLKMSGVEWLGEIPDHWKINKLSRLCYKIGDGLHGTPDYHDGTKLYFINGNNLVNGNIEIFSDTKEVSKESYFSNKKEIRKGTVLLSINGSIGNHAIYNEGSFLLGKSAAYFDCRPEIFNEFLEKIFQSFDLISYFLSTTENTTIKNLSLETLRNTQIPLPPIEEQIEIVKYLNNEELKLSTAINRVEKEIELVKELKQSLIAEVVTGKIKIT